MQSVGWTAAVLLLLGACTRVPDRPMKVGTYPWAGSEPLFLARELNQYPSQAIHLVEFTSANQLARAFRNGVIDAATVPLFDALRFEHMGQQPRVVLMLDSSHGADCLIARREVDSLAALKDKRVAHTGGVFLKYLLARLGARGGLQAPRDIQETVLAADAMEDALKRGEVDAVLASEPLCDRLLEIPDMHPLLDSSLFPGELVDVLVVREEVLKQNSGQVDALLQGWFAALDHYRDNPEADTRLMAPRLGLDEENLREVLAGIRLADMDEQRLHLMGLKPRIQEAIEHLGSMMVKNQLLPTRPDTASLLDAAPLARVKE